jgi:flagellar biosynthesis repressor protein FlbT
MNITLRAGERLFLNGAVIRIDRKATIALLNDVTFLLENHVMQAEEATSPLRQIYFTVQIILMDPANAESARVLASKLINAAVTTFKTPAIVTGVKAVAELVARARIFEALKALRALYPLEHEEMYGAAPAASPCAA